MAAHLNPELSDDEFTPSPYRPVMHTGRRRNQGRYLTIAELRLFSSDDPLHDNDFDDYSDQNTDNDSEPISELEDPLACLDDTLEDEGGEFCELHVYEHRYNSRGVRVTLQVGASDQLPIETHRNPHAALVIDRSYDYSRALESTSLEIRSPYMRKAMQDVIGAYPGVNLDSTGILQLEGIDEPRCLFHYRHELRMYAERSGDDDMKEHVDFLLRYMARSMQKEMTSWQALMESNEKSPGLEFANLWMAFRPGELLCWGEECIGGQHVVRLRTFELKRTKATHGISEYWLLNTEMMDCNGEYVSFTNEVMTIHKYDGYRPLVDLSIFPLKYHKDEAQLRSEILNRGKVWLSLVGVHHRSYRGTAQLRKGNYMVSPVAAPGTAQNAFDTLPVRVCGNVGLDFIC